jgi:hypothetical protein
LKRNVHGTCDAPAAQGASSPTRNGETADGGGGAGGRGTRLRGVGVREPDRDGILVACARAPAPLRAPGEAASGGGE